MHVLDDIRIYAKHDPDDIGFGIDRLAEQVHMAWHDAQEVAIPKTYAKVKHIVVVGMGGSALGAHVLQDLFQKKGKMPFSIVRDYSIPAWVGTDALVILSSYSGTTEEVLAAADDARKKKAKLLVIAAGGTLAAWAKKHEVPAYIFTPGDLAKQPRLGIGFSFAGILGLLARAGISLAKEEDIRRAISAMAEVTDLCANDVAFDENPAKQVAAAIAEKHVLVVGAEHLGGNAHIFANQINETGKQFATYFVLPELNHHLLESFSHPKDFSKNTAMLFLHSSLYHPRTRKRFTVTADMGEEIGIHVVDYVARGKDLLEEACEVLQFSSYVSWYLAMMNKEQTTAIPYVDAFKEMMGKA
jgi:glucose/mannose-6-phosphate isomerase